MTLCHTLASAKHVLINVGTAGPSSSKNRDPVYPHPQFAPQFIAPTPILIVAAYPGSGFRKGFYLHVEGTFGT